jgi:DNA-binding NarL/FixJ family response regulator
MNIKILLADDHAILREGLRSLLEKQKGYEVVAEAGDGRAAVKLAKKYLPDVVIMDITMPDMNGIDATHQLLAEVPETKVIALSVHADKRYVASMLGAGASGYLRKDCVSEELTHAIKSVMNGEVYISPKIVSVISKHFAEASREMNSTDASPLTGKEREVLQLLAEGRSTKDISDLLCISMKTVEKHRQHITEKLGLHSVAELTKYAIREGMTSLEE